MNPQDQMQQPPMGMPQQGMPPQGMQPPQQPDPDQGQEGEEGYNDESISSLIDAVILEKNLATKLNKTEDGKDRLRKIAGEVVEGFDTDYQSCSGWIKNNQDWLKMALLAREDKVFPWPGASNIKYPLMATAAMQFSARAYPTLVPSDNQIVKSRVIGFDPQGQKGEKADRIAKHMSYQIMHCIPNWEEEMDRLLMIEAICGVCFKKTYRDMVAGGVVSKIVYPENLIINYWAKNLADAQRKTEIMYLSNNEYVEKVNNGEFLDLGDIDKLAEQPDTSLPQEQKPRASESTIPALDSSTPNVFLSQHTFYDIDEDGYAEPVVIVVHHKSKQVVRITARFCSDGVFLDDKQKKIVRIVPLEYFTDFQFLPNPDGSIYGLGFGSLLGPINEAVNSLINQLVDAGTLNNLQAGFIAKGLRIQMKESRFSPGEWKSVNATGDELKSSIFPLPSKEPSSTLLQLMQNLIQAGNQLASVAEIFVGKMPGQNTPATTTQETVDQAMKVFTSIYKRNYRALLSEFQKIFKINSMSEDIVQSESETLGIDLQASDYTNPHEIIPAADPSGSSSTAQFGQLQQIGQTLIPLGAINAQEFTLRSLKLIQISDPEKLVNQPQPPPPDPKAELEKAKQVTEQIKQQGMQQKAQTDQSTAIMNIQAKQRMAEIEAQQKQLELEFKQQELILKQHEAHMNVHNSQVEAAVHQQHEVQKAQLDIAATQAHNEQQMHHNELLNQQKTKLMAQQAKTKASSSSNK